MTTTRPSDIRYKSARMPMSDDTGDFHVFDVFPGFWALRHDPSFEALMHSHNLWNIVTYGFVVSALSVGIWKWLGMANRIQTRPLFVVNKKTWVNTKVPRKRARFYDTWLIPKVEDPVK
jgi:hypothetical protein